MPMSPTVIWTKINTDCQITITLTDRMSFCVILLLPNDSTPFAMQTAATSSISTAIGRMTALVLSMPSTYMYEVAVGGVLH